MAEQTGRENNMEFDFAVPGREEEPEQEYVSRPVYENDAKERKISFLWLLQHYSRENAAAYKAQKERRKSEKEGKSQKKVKSEKREKGQPGKRKQKISAQPSSETPAEEIPQKQRAKESREEDNFGETVLVSRDSRPGLSDTAALPRAALECTGFGETVAIQKVPFVIGRSPHGVDLCIADNKMVGRMHAEISYHDGAYFIKDLKSLNHVYLDGRKILAETETELRDKMQILLGNEEFIFHSNA